MAKKIQVTPDVLDAAAKRIENLAQDYQTSYNKLYSASSEMAQSWEGKDNLAFVAELNEFKDDFEKMHQLMMDYKTFLNNSAKAYRDTQDAIVSQAKNLIK